VTEDTADSRVSAALERGQIILFDAECVLCSKNAQIVLTHDKARRFYLAPMQGAVGADLSRRHGLDPENPTSIAVVGKSSVHTDSDAIIAIYAALGWPWRFVALLRIVPTPVRDPVYRLIARNRYRLFGKRAECWLPTAEHRARML
jgi:predicted DCC family thiol-disulfide oxidoreductase YuxK